MVNYHAPGSNFPRFPILKGLLEKNDNKTGVNARDYMRDLYQM